MSERVILAYSGGLDTSVAISWIGKETGREVVAVAIDLGQGGEDMDVIRQRALDCGAVEAVVVDARDLEAEAGGEVLLVADHDVDVLGDLPVHLLRPGLATDGLPPLVTLPFLADDLTPTDVRRLADALQPQWVAA